MAKKQKLLQATFAQSQKFTCNLFKEVPHWCDIAQVGSQKIIDRILNIVLSIFASVLSYVLGIGFPDSVNKFPSPVIGDIDSGAVYFTWLKWPITILIIMHWLLYVIRLFPKKNFAQGRFYSVLYQETWLVMATLSCIPMTMSLTLGVSGWIGFSLICLGGLLYIIKSLLIEVNNIKQIMCGKQVQTEHEWIIKMWKASRKMMLVIFLVIVINMLTFKIGIWTHYTIQSMFWLFILFGPVYIVFIAFMWRAQLKLITHTYYFTKYAQQYRVLWKITDEQWYLTKRVKKIAKKKRKEQKKVGK